MSKEKCSGGNCKIRGGKEGCPFGLPVTMGCKNVGKNIDNMRPIKNNKTEEVDFSNVEYNFKKLFFIITGKEANKRRCPYAEGIDGVKKLTMCSYEEETYNSEEHRKVDQIPISGSPSQINVFDTNPTNNGLPLYGDSSFTDDNIREIPLGLANVGRENSKLT